MRIKVIDLDGGSTNWSVFSDVFNVINNNPEFISFTNKNSEVLRNESLWIDFVVSDVEDSQDNLTVLVEYSSSQSEWSTEYLSDLMYGRDGQSTWSVLFTPSSVAELGNYSIRFDVIDLDNNSTGWLENQNNYNVFVLNNAPTFVQYDMQEVILSTQEILISINSYDVEDTEEIHSIELEYSLDGVWSNEFISNRIYNSSSSQ